MTGFSRRDFIATTAAASVSGRGEAAGGPTHTAAARPLIAYFIENGPKLLRPAQGLFKYPSIAPSLPGKVYSAQLWDWDTLWSARGLLRLAELSGDPELRRQVIEHTKGSLFDFLDNQSPEGRLPIVMKSTDPDANGLPFVAPDRNQAKPVMAQLALLAAERSDDTAWLGPVFDKLMRFHDSWLAHNESKTGLLVWSNDVAIGNDNDPTTFARPSFSSANLLLNCLFYQDLRALLKLAALAGRPQADRDRVAGRIDRLGSAIGCECWDARDAFYYTLDVQCVDRRAELIPNTKRGMDTSWSAIPLRFQEFTGFLPLWCGLASKEHADALLRRNWFADDRLRAAFGVRTLSRLEPMYSLAFSSNPSNWLGPVWIVSNYLVWQALLNYGYRKEAAGIANKTVRVLSADLARNGSLNEYYHPDTGAALSHPGFMDWNMLVLEMI